MAKYFGIYVFKSFLINENKLIYKLSCIKFYRMLTNYKLNEFIVEIMGNIFKSIKK